MDNLIKTVVLTGATGYLGSRLLQKLLDNNYKVCIVRRETSSLQNVAHIAGRFHSYNSDAASIAQLFKEHSADLIIHTATAYGRKGESMLQIKAANLDFPLLLLQQAVDHKVPYFINTGTSLPMLTNLYALFKNQLSECLQFFASQLVSINILLEHFYGPGDDTSKFITSMIKKMKQQEKEILLTAGTQIRDFIFIEDVLEAYLTIIRNLSSFKGYTNLPLGSGEGITIRKMVELIKEYSGSSSELKFGAIPMRENELLKSDADISILKSLGWNPRISMTEGLKQTIHSL